MRGEKPGKAAREAGLEVVDVSRPRESRAEEPLPSSCPTCGGPLGEVRGFEQQMPVGDGHSYTDVEVTRGACESCGWVDL